MKNKLIATILLTLIVFVGCAKGATKSTSLLDQVKDKGIIVGTEGTYKPYTYHDEEGTLTGYDVEVVREVFKRLKIDATFKETAWDGLLAGLGTNRFNLVANQVWRNDSREETYTLSSAYMYAGAVLVVKEDNTDIKTTGDIKGKKGAHSLTSAYAEMSKNAGAEVVSVNSFAEAAENVKFDRVDYTINDKDSFIQYQLSNPDSGLIGYDIEDADKIDVVLALPKEGSTELVEAINKTLEDMREDGTLDKIAAKFLQ